MTTPLDSRRVKSRRSLDGRTRPRRRSQHRPNRRRTNVLRVLLHGACALLAIEMVAAALYSPRFHVHTVKVVGNATVPEERVLNRLCLGREENLFRLPVARLERAVEAEPAVADAQIRRYFPGTIVVAVTEREPFAAFRVADGTFYTVDSGFVPFRSSGHPEPGLPLVRVDFPVPVSLGKALPLGCAEAVRSSLEWAVSHPEFALESLAVDAQGKLCLNRLGGLPVLLGSGIDLDRKLQTLGRLLAERPGLRLGTDIAYVNLFAWDAPALMPRVPVSVQQP